MRQGSLQDANFLHPVYSLHFSQIWPINKPKYCPNELFGHWHPSVAPCQCVRSLQQQFKFLYFLWAHCSSFNSRLEIRSILQFSIFAFLCFSANDTLAWLAATSPFQYSELWNVVNVNKQVLALAAIPGAVLQEFWQRSEVKLRGSMILADFELRTLSTPLTDPSCRPWDKTIRN